MSKKNLGRVKRYRSSFYRSRRFWLRRFLSGAVALAVIFALGWFIGPAVINFGTHTWYSLKDGGREEPVGPDTASSIVTSQPEEAPPTPEPTPTPEPMDTSAGWSYVTLSALGSEDAARATAQDLAAQGVKYAVVTLKDSQGYIYYQSAQELASGSVAATTLDAATAVRVLKEEGIVPVANLYMYQDPVAPYTDTSRTAAVHYQDTDYFWLDAAAENGGKPWLNPYSDLAFQYLSGLIQEVEDLGFEQILLSGVQFPNGATSSCNYGDTAGVSQADQLAAVIDRWQQDAEEAEVTLWFEYSLAMAQGGSVQLGGATPDALGVQNLMVSLPEEQTEETAAQLETARTNSASAQHRVWRSGSTASFDS